MLDLGCGGGGNALYLASKGYDVRGIDISRRAINAARHRAVSRSLVARFEAADVLSLAPSRRYPTLLDFGLFHQFGAEARARYIDRIGEFVSPDGMLILQCFSDRAPSFLGLSPRRYGPASVRELFRSGWSAVSIQESSYEVIGGWQIPALICRFRKQEAKHPAR